MNIYKKLLIIALSAVSLTACGDRVSQAEQEMTKIREMPAPPIAELPQQAIMDDFTYSANSIRSPFVPASLLVLQAQMQQDNGIMPDLNRPKEPLESYELTQLIYRGKITAPNGEIHGLIQLPDNSVRVVKVGQYMGLNHGLVVEITPTQINLEETVFDETLGRFDGRKNKLKSPE